MRSRYDERWMDRHPCQWLQEQALGLRGFQKKRRGCRNCQQGLPLLMHTLCLLQNVHNPALPGSLWLCSDPGTPQTRTALGRRWSCPNAGIHCRPRLKRVRPLEEGWSLTPYRAGHSAIQSLNAALLTNDQFALLHNGTCIKKEIMPMFDFYMLRRRKA